MQKLESNYLSFAPKRAGVMSDRRLQPLGESDFVLVRSGDRPMANLLPS
jgi:phage baseplate assembly protein gpV